MREREILREHGEEPCFFCDSAGRLATEDTENQNHFRLPIVDCEERWVPAKSSVKGAGVLRLGRAPLLRMTFLGEGMGPFDFAQGRLSLRMTAVKLG